MQNIFGILNKNFYLWRQSQIAYINDLIGKANHSGNVEAKGFVRNAGHHLEQECQFVVLKQCFHSEILHSSGMPLFQFRNFMEMGGKKTEAFDAFNDVPEKQLDYANEKMIITHSAIAQANPKPS